MAYDYPEIRQFSGLYRQANSFNVPDGAFEVADNVSQVKENLIQSRRGFYEYYDAVGNTIIGVTTYRNTLVGILDTKIQKYADSGAAPNLVGTPTDFSGEAFTITDFSAKEQAKNNMYFTANEGIFKIESLTSSVFKAGLPQALDLNAEIVEGVGFLGKEKQVAYRVIFSKTDENENLILSAPGDVQIVENDVTNSSYTAVGSVVTVTTTEKHRLEVGTSETVTATNTFPVDAPAEIANTALTVTGDFTFTYTVPGTPAGGGTLDWVAGPRSVRLNFSIPGEINTGEGIQYQVYRTSQQSTTPTQDFKFVFNSELTTTEINRGFVIVTDQTDDIFLGAELYTNPNSQEGELQANYRPPQSQDIGLFKNVMIYGNNVTRSSLIYSVFSPGNLVSGDWIEARIEGGAATRIVGRIGVGNQLVESESVAGTSPVVVTYTAHGLQNSDQVYVTNVTGALAEGLYAISGVTANTFDISSASGATELDFQGVLDTNNDYLFYIDDTSTSSSVKIRNTAEYIVQAFNRDSIAPVYSAYLSGLDGIPGQMSLSGRGFGTPIELRASTTTVGAAFDPILPTAFGSVASEQDTLQHTLFFSKIGEPEAVPLLQFIEVGSANSAITRIVVLRDSVIIIKEDGVFRLNGDTPSNFSVTILDNTVFGFNKHTVARISNQVFFFASEGVILATENSAQIVSRRIEDLIQPIQTAPNVNTLGAVIAYESERLVLFTTLEPQGTTPTVTYAYNVLTGDWTTWNVLFTGGGIGPNDRLYLLSNNKILRERKDFTRIDYCDQQYSITVDSVTSDALSATITSASYAPLIGDGILKDDIINKIDEVVLNGGTSYTLTFQSVTNLIAADSLDLYEGIQHTLESVPFHAGRVGLMKQYSQMQLHLRDASLSRATVYFSTSESSSTVFVDWQTQLTTDTSLGWGNLAWGSFAWGLGDAINISLKTTTAPILRLYIPLEAQRSTFIKSYISHRIAGEPFNLQAVSYAVRSYKERVSR